MHTPTAGPDRAAAWHEAARTCLFPSWPGLVHHILCFPDKQVHAHVHTISLRRLSFFQYAYLLRRQLPSKGWAASHDGFYSGDAVAMNELDRWTSFQPNACSHKLCPKHQTGCFAMPSSKQRGP